MTTLGQDLRYAIRTLQKSPAFALVAVATLALGIGANTAIFSFVDAVLLRPLPYAGADRIVTLGEVESRDAQRRAGGTSYPNFADWQARSRSFESMALFNGWRPALTGLGEAERLKAAYVTSGIFGVLRVEPVLGRAFHPDDNRADAPALIVVSHGFWQRRLGGDRAAIGRSVILNAVPFTVIGVLPEGFVAAPPEVDGDIWANNSPDPRDTRSSRYMRAMGRLKPGVTLTSARAEMGAISDQLAAAYPKENAGETCSVLPLRDALTTNTRAPLLLLLGASGLLLLIACANLGNLLVARGVARTSEFAVRAALGATRGRLMRQLLTESAVLAGAGAAAGLLLAPWGMQLLLVLAPETVRTAGVRMDLHVLGFTLVTAVAAALLAGLLPASRVRPERLQAGLQDGGRAVQARLGGRLRNGLAVAQLALALTLLGLAGLLVKSFERTSRVAPGIRPEGLWTVAVNIPGARYPAQRQPAFFDELAGRALALPGVRSAAVSSVVPFSGDWDRISVEVEGQPRVNNADGPEGDRYIVSSSYLSTMGIPLLAGRALEDTDRYDSPLVAVVDETFARRLAPGGSAIGKRIHLPARDGFAEVVGIVGHVKHYGLDAASSGQIYMSHRQYPWRWMHLLVRASPQAGSLAVPLRTLVRALDPDVPAFDVATMEQLMAEMSATRRFSTLLAAAFAGAAVALAALGLFGLVTYMAAQRSRELAIRMALGAQAKDVVRLVLAQGLRPGVVGTVLGLAGALAGGRLASGMLFEVGAADPAVLAGVGALLLGVALAASYLPARRAARINPIEALRNE